MRLICNIIRHKIVNIVKNEIRGISGISGNRYPPFVNPDTGVDYGHMLDNMPLRIEAPLKEIANVLKLKGIITPKNNRPHPVRFLTNSPDEEIVKWYASLMHGLLSYYRYKHIYFRLI